MKKRDNSDTLAQLFRKLPEEEMPAGLREGIMERVAVQKRHIRLSSDTKGIMVAAFVSLVVIAGVGCLLKYMEISIDFPPINLFDGRYTIVVTVAVMSLVLLVAETLISRHMTRKRLEKI